MCYINTKIYKALEAENQNEVEDLCKKALYAYASYVILSFIILTWMEGFSMLMPLIIQILLTVAWLYFVAKYKDIIKKNKG